MIHSGIAPLDEQLGGVSRGRLHLLTGGPGTGKSTACLQFLNAGLSNGEPVALLTLDRLTDLISHSRSIGLELEPALRAGRLLLLRFREEFGRVLDWTGLPDQVMEDLRRSITEIRPTRLVIDPLTPFLADGSARGLVLAALAQMLEDLGITTVITFPGDVSADYDAHLDQVVQRAAAIIHLTRGDGGIHRMQFVQSRSHAAPSTAVRFGLRAGVGLVMLDGEKGLTELDRAGAKGTREISRRSKAST
jgi:KaiC/GvpD/RAD55 family RecA-like ATPase